MAKILAKIARRHDGEELPDRRELVEMELFDTDRNPWPGELGSGDVWKRYNYDPPAPYRALTYPGTFPGDDEYVVGPIELVVERTSLALAFVGGLFTVATGWSETFAELEGVFMRIQADNDTIGNHLLAYANGRYGTAAPDASIAMDVENTGWGWAVLNPGTYQVRLWVYATNFRGDFAVDFTEIAASIALLPAGLASLDLGWTGVGV